MNNPQRRTKGGERQRTEGSVALKDMAQFGAESIPGVGEVLAAKRVGDAIEEKDYAGAGIEAAAGLVGLVPGVGDLAARGIRKFRKTRKAYKLFVKGEDGELYPLFVDANQPVKKGEFLEANFPDVAFKGKRTAKSEESFYVPTKGAERKPTKYFLDDKEITKKEYNNLGPNAKPFARVEPGEKAKGTGDSIMIPDEETRQKLIDAGFITNRTKRTKEAPFGKVTAVAARPGWHSSQSPVATHLGPQDLKVSKKEVDKLLKAGVTKEAIKKRGNQFYVKRRAEDQVFAEVEMADDVDYQSMLAAEGKTDINDRVPKGGSYRYSDGQADSDQWVVGGDMKVNRELSREEARKIQEELGVKDLPYRDEVEAILGRQFEFNEGGLAVFQGVDDYMLSQTEPEKMMKPKKLMMDKGGMAEQMELFEPVERGFDEGGLMDEGGTTDPVSGNEVPPGSTQEEVRDDIPAQLSEGEFVFPADVVRYIGLENLMRMRQEAKQGLAQMEAMGQMGNSEEATVQDDLPFDMYDLDVEEDGLEMQTGGLVPASSFQNPYGQATQINPNTGTYTLPGTGISGYQMPSGGQTGYTPYAGAAPYFQPVQFTDTQYQTALQTTNLPTFGETVGTKVGQYDELRTYVNDAGQTLQIPFKDGKPIYPIPEGYRPVGDKPAPTEETTVMPTLGETTVIDQGGGDDSTGMGGQTPGGVFGGNANTLKSSAYSKAVATLGINQLSSFNIGMAIVNTLTGQPTRKGISIASNTARNTAVDALGLSDISAANVSQLDAIGSAMNVVTNFTAIGQTAPTQAAAASVAKAIAEAIDTNKMSVEQANTLSELGMDNKSGALTDKNGNTAYNEDDPGTVNPNFDPKAQDAINAYAAAMATDDDEDDSVTPDDYGVGTKGEFDTGQSSAPSGPPDVPGGLGGGPGVSSTSGTYDGPASPDQQAGFADEGGPGGSGGSGSGSGCFAAGTKFFMHDGSLKSVEDIKVGDVMMDGGKVRLSIIGDGSNSDWYMYGATKVTGSHAVKEKGIWKFTRDTENAVPAETEDLLYTIVNTNHRMVAEDKVVYADYDMVDEDGIEEELLEMMNLQEVVKEAA